MFKNFFDILATFGANQPVRGSERIETVIEPAFDSLLASNWPRRAMDKFIGLKLPTQPRTKVVSRDLESAAQSKSPETTLSKPKLNSQTYINCDLRFFNLKYLVEQLGHFEVVHIDPPWRIKGAQRNNSSFMFSNNKFNLEYCTMSNQEIINIPVEHLATKGFCFLWILNSQMNVGYECMNKWGYEVID